MKWFIILATLSGAYYVGLTSMTDLALGQLQSIQQYYVTTAEHADQIVASRP